MADSDKNIIITPNRGATSQPTVRFTGQGNDPIILRVLDGATGTGLTAGGALSFEGSAGQLFSVVNRLGTGSIFSVNDISGIPSIDVDANGTIEFAPFTGYVAIGLTLPTEKLHVSGNILASGRISAVSGLSASGGIGVTGGATFNGNVNIVGSISAVGGQFTALTTFSSGISASGGTFAGTQTFTNGATFSGLATFNSGISATGGITFNAPISSIRLPRTTSAVFDTKTANFTPSNADNGKIFLINHSSKTPVTVSLDSLSIGWRAKFISVNSGAVGFSSSLGTVYGTYGANGGNTQVTLLDPIVEVICYDTNLYFAG